MKERKKSTNVRSCGLNQLFPGCSTLRQFLIKASGEKFHCLPYYDKYQNLLDDVWLVPKDGEVLDGLWQEKLRPVDNIRDLSIAQIINVAVAQMVRSSGTTQNVLCYGYRQKSMNSDDVSVRNWLDIECRFVNTVHSMFMTTAWRHFAAAIGTDCFRQLLDFALFLTASNGSFLQICGPPANAIANKTMNSIIQNRGKVDLKLLRFHIFYNTSPFRSILPSSHSLLKGSADNLVIEIFGTIQNDRTLKACDTDTLIVALRNLCSKLLTNVALCDAAGAMRQFVHNPQIRRRAATGSTNISESDTSDNSTDHESRDHVDTNKRKRTRRGSRGGTKSKRSKLTPPNVNHQVPTHTSSVAGSSNDNAPLAKLASSTMPTVSYIDYLAHFISTNVQNDAQHASFHTQEDDMLDNDATQQAKSFECPAVANPLVKQSQMSSCSQSTKKNKKNKWRKKWRRVLLQKSKSDLGLTQTTDILAEQTMIACEEKRDMLLEQCQIDCGNTHHINRMYRPTLPPKARSISPLKSSTFSSDHIPDKIVEKTKASDPIVSHGNDEMHPGTAKVFADNPKISSNKPETVSLSVPKANVAAYVKAILRRLLPWKDCWGSRHNVNHIMRTVDTYVHLGRHETMSIHQATMGIQLERIPWLQFAPVASQNKESVPTDNHEDHNNTADVKNHLFTLKQSLLTKFMSWLFGRVIGMVVAQAFYVTEAEGHGTDIFYYQKHVWRKIVNEHYPEFRNRFVAVNPFATDNPNQPSQTTSHHPNNPSLNNNKNKTPTKEDTVYAFQRAATVPTTTFRQPQISSNHNRHQPQMPPAKKSTLFNAKIHATVTNRDTGGGDTNTHYQQQRTSSLQSWSIKIAETSHLSRSMSADQWKDAQRLQRQQQANKAKQFSSIRFVPKKTGLRGITNLRTKPGQFVGKSLHSHSHHPTETPMVVTNSMLYNCLHVLKHVYDSDVSLRGFGVFGMDDIYREYRSYWNRLAALYGAEALQAGRVPLYMAAVDLEKCYDNIDPVRLYDLIQQLLLGEIDRHSPSSCTTSAPMQHSSDGFTRSFSTSSSDHASGVTSTTTTTTAASPTRPSKHFYPFLASPEHQQHHQHHHQQQQHHHQQHQHHPSSLKRTGGIMNNQACLIHKYAVTHTMRSMERVVTKHLRYCVLSGETISFADAGPEIADRYRNSVIYDAVMYNKITAKDIMRILKHHLFAQVVRMPSTLLDPQKHSPFCMQVTGIPQGSILSPVLCHLYYGHVENTLFFNALPPTPLPSAPPRVHTNSPSAKRSANSSIVPSPVTAYEAAETKAEQAKLGWWKTSLPEKSQPQTMVIRLMDDYLVISTHASCVQHFLQTAFDSYGLYGGKINPSKTKVNFPVTLSVAGKTETLTLRPPWEANYHKIETDDDSSEEEEEVEEVEKSAKAKNDKTENTLHPNNSGDTNPNPSDTAHPLAHSFSWCGLLIDTHTMEIRPDLTRLLSRALTTSVSIESHRPGVAFRRAIKSFFRMKCHALILDCAMHRLSTVIASLLHLYQLTAARTFAYYQRLHRLYRVHLRPGYVVRCLREGILFAARLISTRMRRAISRKLVLDGIGQEQDDEEEEEKAEEEAEEEDGDVSNGDNRTHLKGPELVTHFGDCAVTVKMAIYLGWKAFREVAIATHFRLHALSPGTRNGRQRPSLRKTPLSDVGDRDERDTRYKHHRATTVDIVACCEENLSRVQGSLTLQEWQALEDALLIEAKLAKEDSQLAQLPRL